MLVYLLFTQWIDNFPVIQLPHAFTEIVPNMLCHNLLYLSIGSFSDTSLIAVSVDH